MPDWRKELQHVLAKAKFSASEREEVSRELAGYLDDLCAESRASGADELSSNACAARELKQDPRLGAHLYRARQEGNMNDRTKQLWLPCILALVGGLAYFSLADTVRFGRVLWIHRTSGWLLAVNIPALIGLPLLGTAAAYWSRRQGAGRVVQAVVGLFPFLMLIAASVAAPQPILLNSWQVIPIRFVSQGFGPFGFMSTGFFPALVWTCMTWIFIPLAALLAGILPVIGRSTLSASKVHHA